MAHPKYANDISGYGSLIVPGRWNFQGVRVLYTSENSSLALLEYLAHTEGLTRRLPYQLITIHVPETEIKITSLSDLAPNWKEHIIPTRETGNQWLEGGESLVMKVPSVINEDNCNYLINPEHAHFEQVKVIGTKEITFDKRLW
ncbi:RES family NAD+ phosphorylase [Fulvivirga sp. M361]|uniref:RES family NAD+ phosphorylase n=1 Tax=Fulvivirga sp. M361 TaxID=2594266 RepID=UPI001623EF76|nr:RES family NAD+ phosphorylase [Fulvivirga sp. M361]